MCKMEEQATMRLNFLTAGNYSSEDRARWGAKVEFYLMENELNGIHAAHELAQDMRDTISYEENPLQLQGQMSTIYAALLGLALGHVDWEGRAQTMVNDQIQEWRYSGRYEELVEELELSKEVSKCL